MQTHAFVYLASQSPRRAQLLDQLGVAHRPLLPAPEEDAEALELPQPREAPASYVQRVTAAKLQAAIARLRLRGLPAAPILCADTTVALGRRLLGKPADAHEARETLLALSGREHRVLTAVAVAGAGGRQCWQALSVSTVRFAPLPARVVRAYIDSAEPFGKAGAYAIQGALAGWIERISGSHSGIMGLPLHEAAKLLRQARVRMPLA